jgi:hypothetical protein
VTGTVVQRGPDGPYYFRRSCDTQYERRLRALSEESNVLRGRAVEMAWELGRREDTGVSLELRWPADHRPKQRRVGR